MKDNCTSFRLILLAIGTLKYDSAKHLVPSEYTVHDSFSFAIEVGKCNSNNLVAGLNVETCPTLLWKKLLKT